MKTIKADENSLFHREMRSARQFGDARAKTTTNTKLTSTTTRFPSNFIEQNLMNVKI